MTSEKIVVLISFFLFALLSSAFAVDEKTPKEIDSIMHASPPELNAKASALLEKKYPDEDWDAYNFPSFVYTSDEIETGYKIAVKEPQLLKQTFCYCFCDSMGHASLLSCFWKDGKVGGAFDSHGAYCNICITQAMQALLVYDLGASEKEVDKLMETRFKKNIEKQKNKTKNISEGVSNECNECGD